MTASPTATAADETGRLCDERRRDCHFADTPSAPLLKYLLKGEGSSLAE